MTWLREHRHLIAGWTWAALAVPTVVWWKDALVWVALMSVYANAESSFGAHRAQRAEES